MTVAAMGVINGVSAIMGGTGQSSNNAQNQSLGYTSNFLLDKLGAGGDPGGWLWNQMQAKKDQKYQKKQDEIKNALTKEQTKEIRLRTKAAKAALERQDRIRALFYKGV